MTASALKWIALITMITDHIGLMFFPEHIWIRLIGRVSFPIFVFLMAEGFAKTSNRPRYFGRLFIFAVLSELPYDLAMNGKLVSWEDQNIFWELLLGFGALLFLEKALREKKYLWLLGIPAIAAVTLLSGASYGLYGIVLIMGFYLLRGKRWGTAAVLVLSTVLFYGLVNFSFPLWGGKCWILMIDEPQLFAIGAVLPLVFYSGKKGRHSFKWLFYLAYPLHLLILWGIWCLVSAKSF